MISAIVKFILFLGLFYLGATAYLYWSERSYIYIPDNSPLMLPDIDVEQYTDLPVLSTDGVNLKSWFHLGEPTMPTILYLHGNAGNINDRIPLVRPYINEGYSVLLLEYRGYGGNPGQPSEQGLYNDARGAIETLMALKVMPDQIVLYGESLGTAVAIQMANEFPVKAIILQSPFSSLVDLASAGLPYFPVRTLMRDRYDSINKIDEVTTPKLFLHGTKDKIVPIRFSKPLYEAAAEPKIWKEYPNKGHNDLNGPEVSRDVLNFLDQLPQPRLR